MSATVLFRKSLVTFQFIVTIFLIAGSSVLYLQLRYMQNKNLGFNKDQVLSFHISDRNVREHIEDLKTQLLQDPSIEAVAAAGNPIGNNDIGTILARFEQDGAIAKNPVKVQSFYADADYLPTLQIRLLAGRNFSAAQPTDKLGSVLINETLLHQLGWTDAINKRVQLNDTTTATVIGVVKDFNIYSLHHKIEPLLLQMPPIRKEEDNCCIRINSKQTAKALKYIAAVYKKWDPTSSFEYHFLDENFSRQYAAEKKQGQILLVFTTLAIFIACMGLFGLVTFSVGQRTKEIGVRKVLGASVSRIVLLVSKELIKPVLIAILISTPLAWYAMYRWLQSFAYRMEMSIWIFLSAGLAAALIAAITVGWRAMRAAKANPVKSLRAE